MAMPEGTSAGTIVAAVLETAGYVAQASILEDFQQFWHSAGVFVFLLCALAGVISAVLSGSFHHAKYLIIGPALYYFAVMEREDIRPVMWKIGLRDATAVNDQFVGEMARYRPGQHIEVAWLFNIVARISSEFALNLSKVVLSYETDPAKRDELMFLTKDQALYSLVNYLPTNPETIGMLSQTMFKDCNGMMSLILALSGKDYSAEQLSLLSAASGGGDVIAGRTLEQLQARKSAMETELARYNESPRVPMSRPMVNFVKRETQLASEGRQGKDYTFLATYKNLSRAEFLEQTDSVSVTCRQAMNVVTDAMLLDGKVAAKFIADRVVQDPRIDNTNNRRLLCNMMAQTLHNDYVEGPSCDLGVTLLVYTLRNSIMGSGLSTIADAAKSRMSLIKSNNSYICTDRLNREPQEQILQRGPGESVQFRVTPYSAVGSTQYKIEARPQNGEDKDYCTIYQADAPGMMDTAFRDQQRYAARGLMQGIYSYSLQIPYIQGMLLYYIALLYPFLALILIVPGKASQFLNILLAWLWVKSWDIGFAAVIVFDRLLWNLLPQSDLEYNATIADSNQLPDLLSSVLRVDPTYDIHAHFNYVSIALYAVPFLTGAIMLKGKATIAASLIHIADNVADVATSRGSDTFGKAIVWDRNYQTKELGAFAKLAVGAAGQGILGGDTTTAAKFGGVAAAVNLGAAAISTGGHGSLDYKKSLTSAAASGVKAASQVYLAELENSAEYQQVFHPLVGMDSEISMMKKANVAAFDGTDAYEINDMRGRSDKPREKEVALTATEVKLGRQWMSEGLKSLITMGGKNLSPNWEQVFKRFGGGFQAAYGVANLFHSKEGIDDSDQFFTVGAEKRDAIRAGSGLKPHPASSDEVDDLEVEAEELPVVPQKKN